MHKVRHSSATFRPRYGGLCVSACLWLCSAVTLESRVLPWRHVGQLNSRGPGGSGSGRTFDVSTVCLEEKEKSCTSHRTTLHIQSVSHCRIM